MSTLYIRLPSRTVADSAAHWHTLACRFALVSHGSIITRQGEIPLSGLTDTIAGVQRVVLLLSASDVSLLRVRVPPLSAAKLKAALPNLVEDQLLADPADCVVVAGGVFDGLRTVAVAQRVWLQIVAKAFIAFGARHLSAIPAQLCLPHQPGSVTAAIDELDGDIELTMRLSEHDGIGLSIRVGQKETAAREVIQALRAVVPETPITLDVPQASAREYQEAVSYAGATNINISDIGISGDNWTRWLAGAQSTLPDLMAGLGAGSSPGLDWKPWRWPLALVSAVLLINAFALNIDWWRMKREAATLRASMIQVYKSAYPKETVIIDPIAQMQQKIASAKRESGMSSPDDFIAITAALGEAWPDAANSSAGTAIAAFEYRDRSLVVRMKPGRDAPTQQMKAALAERNLALELSPEQSDAVVWKIRSTK